jgi:hypothetical protein
MPKIELADLLPLSIYLPPRARTPWTLESDLGHDRLRRYSLARWGLVEALKLGPDRPEVLVPQFICREVLAAVHLAGKKPLFYSVSRRLGLDENHAELPSACAILAVDYFGFPQDLKPFEKYCKRTGTLLIEDNAHGLLSRDESGRPLGTRAPVGLLSPRKTVGLSSGGVLVVNDEALWAKVPAQLPASDDPGPALAFLKRRKTFRALTPLLGPRGMAAGISILRALKRRKDLDPKAEVEIATPPAPQPDLLAPITVADPEFEIRRRRDLWTACHARLRDVAGIEPVFMSLPDHTAPYAYAFRAERKALSDAADALRGLGILNDPWPDLPGEVKPPAYHRSVRLAHFLW